MSTYYLSNQNRKKWIPKVFSVDNILNCPRLKLFNRNASLAYKVHLYIVLRSSHNPVMNRALTILDSSSDMLSIISGPLPVFPSSWNALPEKSVCTLPCFLPISADLPASEAFPDWPCCNIKKVLPASPPWFHLFLSCFVFLHSTYHHLTHYKFFLCRQNVISKRTGSLFYSPLFHLHLGQCIIGAQ